MDANEDVRSPRMKSFSMELGLINPILNQHTNLPATCDKNSQRQSIDAIWTTPCLSPLLSGYLPFGSGCPSDHRVLWIDLPKDHFLGESPKLSPPRPRRLKASDPRLVDRYINLLLPQLRQHNLIRHLRTVQSEAHNNGWNPTLEKEYNDINKLQIQLRRQVETKVRKLRSGGVPWSPALQKHRDTILALRLLIKKRNRRQVSNQLIRRTLEKTDLQDAYTKNYDELQHLLTNAFSEYKNTRAQAESLRDEFLPSLAQARANRWGTSYNQELQQLQRIENQRKLARTIRKMRKKLDRPPTTQVYVTENNQRRLATTKEDVEQVCSKENDSQRYTLYAATPCQPPRLPSRNSNCRSNPPRNLPSSRTSRQIYQKDDPRTLDA